MLVQVHQPDELGEVVAEGCAYPPLAGRHPAPSLLGIAVQVGVQISVLNPGRKPLLPSLQSRRDSDEVVVIDPLGHEPRGPVLDRRGDPLVRHGLDLLDVSSSSTSTSRPRQVPASSDSRLVPKSFSMTRAALRPGPPETEPPGCVVAPV